MATIDIDETNGYLIKAKVDITNEMLGSRGWFTRRHVIIKKGTHGQVNRVSSNRPGLLDAQFGSTWPPDYCFVKPEWIEVRQVMHVVLLIRQGLVIDLNGDMTGIIEVVELKNEIYYPKNDLRYRDGNTGAALPDTSVIVNMNDGKRYRVIIPHPVGWHLQDSYITTIELNEPL